MILPFLKRLTYIIRFKEEAGKYPSPDSEKKYVPVRGAVNFPDCKSMAPPTLSISTSNGIGVSVWLNEI
jgi:hypothetical protein